MSKPRALVSRPAPVIERGAVHFLGFDPDSKDSSIACVARAGAGGASWRVVFVESAQSAHETPEAHRIAAAGCGAYGAVLAILQAGGVLGGICAEDQEYAAARATGARPKDLGTLGKFSGAFLAGAASAAWANNLGGFSVLNPKPLVWKGSVPKEIQQARTYASLGLPYEKFSAHCSPLVALPSFGGYRDGQLADIGDAIGLALWAARQ